MLTLSKLIKNHAKDLGFHLVSIIPAQKLAREGENFEQWLEEGNAADLEYMKKDQERRADPQKSLGDARSIICLAMNYYRELPNEIPLKMGRVARYAWGKDYHAVIEKKLKKLRKFIMENADVEMQKNDFKIYSDAGPLLERAYASKAGLGFIGKNTNLITPEHGSWVLLAELITNIDLEYDQTPINQNLCGNCTRCIDACPTKALCEPYKIDARKCISYQTIENKGGIPKEIREKMGNRAFGCDICQEVCPFNQKKPETDAEEFLEDRAGPLLDPQEITSMSEEAFDNKFAGSPVRRAGQKGLIRNMKHML